MRKVVTNSDLKKAIGMKGFFGTCVAGMAYGVLGLGKINRLFDEAADYHGVAFADHLLENMNVTFDFPQEQLENIPKEGPFVVVSNHPFGGIEGVMMLSLVSKVRPDFKIMANFILSYIPNLKDVFLSVNPFENNPEWKSSFGGIKGAIQQLADGHGLGVFPAGEVSRYHGHDYPEDLPWSKSISKIIMRAGVPVVPLYWDGRNSKLFYAVDKVHNMLGTARLMRELANKHDHCISLQIGKPITAAEIAEYEDPGELAAYLRARTYALEANLEKSKPQLKIASSVPLGEAVDTEKLLRELTAIHEKDFLFNSGNYDCYLADYEEIPNIIREIARLREESFRAIGEGTGKALDWDDFDKYYKHLILWDKDKQRIAGSYRLGIGSEIIPKFGVKGFYVNTLFDIDASFSKDLAKTIELGRSFVTLDYQKEVLPLMALLRGLSIVVVRYPNIEHFIGPVSISASFPKFYQSLIAEYVSKKHSVQVDLKDKVVPHTPFIPDFLKVDPEALLSHAMQGVDRFDKFVFRLSNGNYRLPTLFKKYLKLNAKFLYFNIDPDFNDTLDALLFLKFTDFPEDEVMPLFRDSSDGEKEIVRKRFGYI